MPIPQRTAERWFEGADVLRFPFRLRTNCHRKMRGRWMGAGRDARGLGYWRCAARTDCAWVLSIHISHRPDLDPRSSTKR